MLGIRRQGKVRGRSRRRCRSRRLWLVSVSLYRSGHRGAGAGGGSGSGLPCANKSEIHQPSAGQPAHMSNCWAGRSCNLMPQWEKCWASEWPKLHMLFHRWMSSLVMAGSQIISLYNEIHNFSSCQRWIFIASRQDLTIGSFRSRRDKKKKISTNFSFST